MKAFTALVVMMLVCGCAPEVGTKAWCDDMDDTPKGDWSANDAKAYARYCVLKTYKDETD